MQMYVVTIKGPLLHGECFVKADSDSMAVVETKKYLDTYLQSLVESSFGDGTAFVAATVTDC